LSSAPLNLPLEGRDNSPQWDPYIDNLIAKNAAALKLARQSRDFDEILSPDDGHHLRNLWSLLLHASLRQHRSGNDSEAIELLFDARHIASIAARSPDDTEFADRIIDYQVEQRLARIAPTLAVEGAPIDPLHAATQPAPRAAIQSLIALLSDDSHVHQRTKNYFRYFIVDDIERAAQTRRHLLLLKPLATSALSRTLNERLAGLSAADEANYPSANWAMRHFDERSGLAEERNLQTHYTALIAGSYQSTDALLWLKWRDIAERRTVATDLAIQLFRADHQRWPDSLDALVPKYIASVPVDPFDVQKRPIGYLVTYFGAGQRPMLRYGVVSNSPPPTPQYESFASSRSGRWLDLSEIVPPPLAPTTLPRLSRPPPPRLRR
jgi:hypothetical protein